MPRILARSAPGAIVGALLALNGLIVGSAHAETGAGVEFSVQRGSGPPDVAPAPDGSVWYTGQRNGTLGRLYPDSGQVHSVSLRSGSAPHGVIVGPDGAAWVTDGGRNAI